jgi:predicted ATP-dependent endonuclease of OLD family
VILIDEPQSFLHPGAVRKLFEILRNQPHNHSLTDRPNHRRSRESIATNNSGRGDAS